MSRLARAIVLLTLAYVVGFNTLLWMRNSHELDRMHAYCDGLLEPWPDCIEPYSWEAYGVLYLLPWIAGDAAFLAGGCVVAVVWIKRRRIPMRPDTT